ncbi:glycosyltransferase [Pedobacter sp. SYP-B3415]|uniref:glycosyltransferase n=1 Tax=Pedobacter sp. SYP-B3415 TaxID=2496641 RepID=UPI00101BD2BE|nr:glycosyltransferase [Pedobacter sp. SYP-B3415]
MVSAIILSYNRCSEVLITLQKLFAVRRSLPFALEIIVVDNASIDDTSAQVSRLYPDAVLITKQKNNGIAGWNDGFAKATGQYMLVLDDDSCVEQGLTEAVAYMEQHPQIGILACNIVDEDLKGDPALNPDEAWKDGEEVAGFIGCGALIRKEVYDAIGGYADWIYLYTHEFDYSIRCMQAGYKIEFFENALVVHRVSKLNRLKKNMLVFATRNELAIVYKYFSTERLRFLVRTLLNNLKILKREGFRSAWYVALGFGQFLRLRGDLERTPVSAEVQAFYAENFWSTKPVLRKRKN